MEFKQLVMNETNTKYKEMSKGATLVPLSQSISVVDSKTYSQKRDNYLNRLTREKNAFNSAIKEIIKTRDERLKYEKQRSLERKQQREKTAKNAKLLFYWVVVVVLIVVNLSFAHTAMKDAFQEVDGGAGLPWATLWPSWLVLVGSFFVIAILSLKSFDEPSWGMGVMILEVLAVLIFGIVIACKCPTGHPVSNAVIGLIRCAIAYVVPVVVGGFVAAGVCCKDA